MAFRSPTVRTTGQSLEEGSCEKARDFQSLQLTALAESLYNERFRAEIHKGVDPDRLHVVRSGDSGCSETGRSDTIQSATSEIEDPCSRQASKN